MVLDESRGAVRVRACPASTDQRLQPGHFLDQAAAPVSAGDPVEGAGQPGKPVHTGAALLRALTGQVRSDARCTPETTLVTSEDVNHPGFRSRVVPPQRLP